MKILTYIPVWKRPDITTLCYKGLKRVYDAAPEWVEITTLIVASNQLDAMLAKKHGFEVVMKPNKPLGTKFNQGLLYGLSRYDWDYLFQLNSDDLLSTDFWDLFTPYIEKKVHFFGVDRLYFYDSASKDIRIFNYALGCGIRMIRRDVIELSGFVERKGMMEFELWNPDLNAGLDNASTYAIEERGNCAQMMVRDREIERPVVIDIKSETNIHPFKEFRNAKQVKGAHRLEVLRRFPELYELEKKIQKPQ